MVLLGGVESFALHIFGAFFGIISSYNFERNSGSEQQTKP